MVCLLTLQNENAYHYEICVFNCLLFAFYQLLKTIPRHHPFTTSLQKLKSQERKLISLRIFLLIYLQNNCCRIAFLPTSQNHPSSSTNSSWLQRNLMTKNTYKYEYFFKFTCEIITV